MLWELPLPIIFKILDQFGQGLRYYKPRSKSMHRAFGYWIGSISQSTQITTLPVYLLINKT